MGKLRSLPRRSHAVHLLVGRLEHSIAQDGIVIEQEADCIEAVALEKLHVP